MNQIKNTQTFRAPPDYVRVCYFVHSEQSLKGLRYFCIIKVKHRLEFCSKLKKNGYQSLIVKAIPSIIPYEMPHHLSSVFTAQTRGVGVYYTPLARHPPTMNILPNTRTLAPGEKTTPRE